MNQLFWSTNMVRSRSAPAVPVFHSPMLLDWTEEKLRQLDQDQLLNLLGNLDKQRHIGRIGADAADALDRTICSLLNARNATKRRKAVAAAKALQPDA
jgi:hypothetical protein